MITTRRLVAGYLALMLAATALYFVPEPASSLAVMILGLGGAGAILVGVRRYRPPRARPWRMLAAALAVNAIARVVLDALPGQPGVQRPWLWIVWILHLVVALLLIGGVIGMARGMIRSVAALLDAAVIALGVGLLAAMVIAIPYASLPGTSGLYAGVRVAYVLRDVLILAAALLLVTAVRRTTSVLLLFTGLLGLLTYDLVFRVGRILGQYLTGTAIDLLLLLFYVAIGTAALVPSMAATGAPRRMDGAEAAPLRLVPVAVAAALPSAVLVAKLFGLPVWYEELAVIVATLVLILVFARVVNVKVRLLRQVEGERVLREGITDLAAAVDTSEVTVALDRTVRRLLSPGTDYRLILAPAGRDWPRLDSTEAVLVEPATLSPGLAAQLGDDEPAISISLARPRPTAPAPTESIVDTVDTVDTHDSPVDEDHMVLLVRSDRRSLDALLPRLEVLAAEAALALERIRLHDEVIQHTSEAYFRALVQNSADVILIVDDANRIRYASPSATGVLDTSPLRGIALPTLVEYPNRAAVAQLLDRARASRQQAGERSKPESVRGDWTIHSVGRTPAEVEVSIRDLRHDPSVAGLVVTLRDVTQPRRLERELKQRAFHDPLTGLGNRLAFSGELEKAVRGATADRLVAALFIDLDDLKVINDGLGHDVGDALLVRVGERLRRFVADNEDMPLDSAARLGGDEFAVLVTGVRDRSAADQAADRLAVALSHPYQIGGQEARCTASVGVATTAEDVDSAAELLRHADLALYAAKGAGKGQWSHYEPWMRNAVMDRLELRSALEHAVAEDALFLEYQPIVALETGRLVGFEALLRWLHPRRGRLTPDKFISVAEDSGLIVPIGEWVLTTAIQAIQRWAPDGPPYIAVNVSVRQFQNPEFVATVRRVLADSGLPPERLMLEITESLLLRDDETTWHDLQQLRETGIRVAIDDFGTGYSALSYLRQVPLDVVKLDRVFTQHMAVSAQQRRLVEGIVGLTEVLGLQVVAEGIETDRELSLAKQVGCAYGQGHLLGAPMPTDAVPGWLTSQRVFAA